MNAHEQRLLRAMMKLEQLELDYGTLRELQPVFNASFKVRHDTWPLWRKRHQGEHHESTRTNTR
jgi:hypothetical protein